MKKTWCLLWCIASVSLLRAQGYTAANLQNITPALFKVEHRQTFLFRWVATLPETDPFYDLAKNNLLYLNYLQTNYSAVKSAQMQPFIQDSSGLLQAYRQALATDTAFNRLLMPVLYWYLQAKQIPVPGYEAPAKTVISRERLFDIGARFYFATHITEAQTIGWMPVCVSENGHYATLATNPYPLVEAFCFMTLFNLPRQHAVVAHYKAHTEKIAQQTRLLPAEERLTEAREEMFRLMKNDADMQRVLLEAYDRKKEMLPFIVQ